MKKCYLVLIYFLFFVPCGVFYKIFKKPIFIENHWNLSEHGEDSSRIILMLNEQKKQEPSIFIRLLEIMMPKYAYPGFFQSPIITRT